MTFSPYPAPHLKSPPPPPVQVTPPPLPQGADRHLAQKAYEILGAKEKFSFGYAGTAAVLVPPLCGATPPPPPVTPTVTS